MDTLAQSVSAGLQALGAQCQCLNVSIKIFQF
jgi:hypothetical protein